MTIWKFKNGKLSKTVVPDIAEGKSYPQYGFINRTMQKVLLRISRVCIILYGRLRTGRFFDIKIEEHEGNDV